MAIKQLIQEYDKLKAMADVGTMALRVNGRDIDIDPSSNLGLRVVKYITNKKLEVKQALKDEVAGM